MFETVSVNQALKAGQRRINFPVFLIMMGISAGLPVLVEKLSLPGWLDAVFIPGGFVAAWVYWSFAITKWRVWAFDNVRNVHELRDRAVADKLIWPDGHFFNRTEIWTQADKLKWAGLQLKFEIADIYDEDYTVPTETVVYYSKKKIYGEIVFCGLFFAGSTYMFLTEKNDYRMLIGMVAFPVWIIIDIIRLSRSKMQITMSTEGIVTAGNPFCKWDYIANEDATVAVDGLNGTLSYLYLDETSGKWKKVSISLENLSLKPVEIQQALYAYRARADKRAGLTYQKSKEAWTDDADFESGTLT